MLCCLTIGDDVAAAHRCQVEGLAEFEGVGLALGLQAEGAQAGAVGELRPTQGPPALLARLRSASARPAAAAGPPRWRYDGSPVAAP